MCLAGVVQGAIPTRKGRGGHGKPGTTLLMLPMGRGVYWLGFLLACREAGKWANQPLKKKKKPEEAREAKSNI